MGTLTADCPRLDAHCPHKLATSCRLTSTANCCACADERAHSRTYRVYIDGVGFVQRGTRWQGYCWFCKEFWTNRLAATDPPLDTSQTRVPEIPDQTEFLERWNEFHQGYRVAKSQDGTEQRMPVIGEPFKEVSPGLLPRTLDQLRAGVVNDATRPENRLRQSNLAIQDERPEEPQQSLESALDSLLAEVSDDETLQPSQQLPGLISPVETPQPTVQPRPMNRGEARLARARERFARTFGTREEIQHEDYESPLSTMYNRAYDRYRQAEERRATDTTSPPPFDGLSAQERREIEEQLLWGVMRDSATTHGLETEDNVWSYAPRRPQAETSDSVIREETARSLIDRQIFEGNPTEPNNPAFYASGSESTAADLLQTREILVRQLAREHPSFVNPTPPSRTPGSSRSRRFPVSPSSTSFTSRTGRSRSPLQPLPNLEPPHTRSQDRADASERPQRQLNPFWDTEREWERRLQGQASSSARPSSAAASGSTMSPIQTSISQITSELQRLRLASEAITSARHSMHSRFTHTERPTHTLDNQPDRPEPLSDEDMTKTLACQVCYQQLADVALLPCGHMVMCQWCADVVVPVKHGHLPIRPCKCPMCRKVVKQRYRIHT
ncbi:hypothetical protein CC86DRAFT_460505 [Ophiobolus disseminans]|uniref:RING-type domain-containing protein n=1 Tax=Ophiobolus disseminans TaxID=1469910 RepID=A0A6A6ZE41_9PLEO|nr:hypothetical protein CC86DRAFT_460505 [Ophiobolus disseminans]